MPRVHTHYDNLKVARDAPMEVIHAAYKSLAAIYHRPGSRESERIMRIISNSYIALCDPARKRDHDRWIAQQDSVEFVPPASEPLHQEPVAPKNVPLPIVRKPFGRGLIGFSVVIVAVMLIGAFLSSTSSTPTTITVPALKQPTVGDAPDQIGTPETALLPKVASPEPPPLIGRLAPVYTRPPLAPNGEPWPSTSAYLAGYKQFTEYNKEGPGQATVTVNNQENGSDFLVKLFDREFDPPVPIRRLLLLSHNTFVMKELTAGTFDIRYKDLATGIFRRSQPFTLRDDEKISNFSITLYKVINGNTHSDIISKEEFGQ